MISSTEIQYTNTQKDKSIFLFNFILATLFSVYGKMKFNLAWKE